jgi:hypothetical protein
MPPTIARTAEQQRRKEVDRQLRREQGKPINASYIKEQIKLKKQKTLCQEEKNQ